MNTKNNQGKRMKTLRDKRNKNIPHKLDIEPTFAAFTSKAHLRGMLLKNIEGKMSYYSEIFGRVVFFVYDRHLRGTQHQGTNEGSLYPSDYALRWQIAQHHKQRL